MHRPVQDTVRVILVSRVPGDPIPFRVDWAGKEGFRIDARSGDPVRMSEQSLLQAMIAWKSCPKHQEFAKEFF